MRNSADLRDGAIDEFLRVDFYRDRGLRRGLGRRDRRHGDRSDR